MTGQCPALHWQGPGAHIRGKRELPAVSAGFFVPVPFRAEWGVECGKPEDAGRGHPAYQKAGGCAGRERMHGGNGRQFIYALPESGNGCTGNQRRTLLKRHVPASQPFAAVHWGMRLCVTGALACMEASGQRGVCFFCGAGHFLRAFPHWADGNYSLPLLTETERIVGYEKNCPGMDATLEADAL